MTNRLTMVDNTCAQYHRSHIIIHSLDGHWIDAEFETVEQLDFFAQTLGFTYEAVKWEESERFGIYREYRLSHILDMKSHKSIWSLEEVPEGAKPIKALCNGSIVTCYFTNDGETIRFYRPNPNAKNIYHPLSIENHIAHKKIYGSY